MSVSALTWAFAQEIRPATHKFVLVALADYANEDLEAYPSIGALEAKTCLDRKAIFRSLTSLKELGLIEPTGECKGATKKIPIYRLKQCPKGNSSQRGIVPNMTSNSPQMGMIKQSPNGNTEPSVLLTVKEPSVARLDFIDQLRPLYPGIDIDNEVRKLRAWLLTPRGQGKTLTRQRLVNWMNRCDSPIEIVQRKKPDPLAGLTAEEKAAGGFYD